MKSPGAQIAGYGKRQLTSWLCGLVAGLFLVSVPSLEVRASEPDFSFTNWPPTQEWSDLTNNLWQCYSGIVLRCQAANISTDDFDPPTNCWPMYEYTRFAAKLSSICTSFVCQTNANALGNFEGLTAANTRKPNDEFPMWTASNLFRYCQVTNMFGDYDWNTNMPVQSWEIASHAIQTQVVSVLTSLVWTVRDGGWTADGMTNENMVQARELSGYESTYTHLVACAQSYFPTQTGGDTHIQTDYTSTWWGVTNNENPRVWYRFYRNDSNKRQIKIFRLQAKIDISNICTSIPIESVTFHVFCTTRNSTPGTNIWDRQNEDVSQDVWRVLCTLTNIASTNYLITTNWLGTNTYTIVPPNWRTDLTDTSTDWYTQGWEAQGKRAVFKWQFPAISNAVIYPNHPWPDLDRDDLVDIGIGTERFGPDTGAMVYRADQDLPYVVLPLAAPPVWYGGLHPKAYLSQGGTTNLPYQYLVPPLLDYDGWYTANSLYTRIVESGSCTNLTDHVKRASVLRPRGTLVEFDFPWQEAITNFLEKGYPIGLNSNRTYVLWDET
ncbi:MAG: hypothetical protein WCP86_04070, partial [bacterium]